MDETRDASYGRAMRLQRPSLAVAAVTVTLCILLAAGGYLAGTRDHEAAPAPSVPLAPAERAADLQPIIVPSSVDLPRR